MAISRKDLSPKLQAMIAAQEGKRIKKAPSHTPGVMNKTERAYADCLDMQIRLGHVTAWWFESVKLRIAKRCWLTFDFLILYPNGRFAFHDTKGWTREDALIKAKVAAEKFPWPVFFVKRNAGAWEYKRIGARRTECCETLPRTS